MGFQSLVASNVPNYEIDLPDLRWNVKGTWPVIHDISFVVKATNCSWWSLEKDT